ncbi:MAG TPA: LacI family DNA-binding transcriptional regulator [Mycobacteriales bacterium]|nr:LacI family DNA-binding transcriptional regulator [Mycobacteriales bacterium]
MRVTGAEVARRAGVSVATVSYVLNDAPDQRISPQTRETVVRIARELGYRPNAAARSLRTGHGTTVLFPLPGMRPSHVLSQIIDACTAALDERGLSLVTDYAGYGDIESQLAAWARLDPAAVIDLLIPHDSPVRAALRDAGVPIVSAAVPGETSWESTGDAFARAERLTQLRYLLDRGHRRVVFVLPPNSAPNRLEEIAIRQLRAEATARDARLKIRRARLTREAMTALAADWIAQDLGEALAAYNDDYAIGAISALTAAGIRVPQDVAVMGVDDMPLASVVTPAITTIAAEFDEFSVALADSVADTLRDGNNHAVRPLPTPGHRLVIRDSA